MANEFEIVKRLAAEAMGWEVTEEERDGEPLLWLRQGELVRCFPEGPQKWNPFTQLRAGEEVLSALGRLGWSFRWVDNGTTAQFRSNGNGTVVESPVESIPDGFGRSYDPPCLLAAICSAADAALRLGVRV
ncbi:MAG TPA: hypothetical protein VNH18_07365 [Bryobacteraceae bacterium]|nr:hypothetical protein [Bryobacteraceae bacterium]